MEKDAYYFPHFSTARNDRKIKRLMKQLGIEGYGIYFLLLEVLREQTDFCYPIEDVDLLADDFNTSTEKVLTVINTYDLFIVDDDQFFSPKLIEFLEPYLKMKEQRRRAGIASGEARRNKSNNRSTGVEHVLNENEQSKVKESKVKEKKENESKEKHSPTQFLKNGTSKENAFLAIRGIHQNMTENQYFQFVDQFEIEQNGKAKIWTNERDTQAHFVSWAMKQKPKNGFKVNPNLSDDFTPAEQVGFFEYENGDLIRQFNGKPIPTNKPELLTEKQKKLLKIES